MNEPIRVLQVVTIMNLGGLENFIMNLYRSIDRTRVQFDFLVHRQERGAFDDEIEKLGGKIYRLSPIRPLNFFKYKKQIKNFFNKNSKFKIVHSHLNANSAIILYEAKRARIPVRIAHSHTDETINHYYLFRKVLKTQVKKYSTDNFACSVSAGKWLFDKAKFSIFNNSIDVFRFKFDADIRKKIRLDLGLTKDQILIGNISNFSKPKNIEFLIDVFYHFNQIDNTAMLILVGDGSLKNSIKEKLKNIGIDNKVIFTNQVFNPEDYMCAMDLFLFPSLFEGFPLTLVEAQCNGLQILMSDTISREIILTDLIEIKSLNTLSLNWAVRIEGIIKQKKDLQRFTYFKQLKDKGFDVKDNAEVLLDFYLRKLGENSIKGLPEA